MKKLFFVLSLLSGCFIGFSVVRPSSYASVTPAACLRDSLSRTNADGSVFTEYVARPLPTLVQSGVPSYDEDLFTADPQLNSPGFQPAVGCRAAQQFIEPLSLPAGTVRSDYAFGQIPYTSDVTPTGARTYTVPIAVPEDLKFPSGLALQYSSQDGNGIAGYGWSLSGLPAITITGKNLYYDSTSKAPDLNDSSPVFSLDGMRLVNSNGPLRTSYSLETVTGHILVHPFWDGLVLQHFDVLYPDGSKAVFGFPGDTKTRISYPLTKMTDRYGREVIVSYDVEDANGTNYPSSVRCVEKGEMVWRAVFSYMLRMDTFSSYYAGQRVFLRQMLTDIKTYFNGQRTYTYKLAYTSKDSVMELKAIRCLTSEEELPPLNFSYGENVTQYGQDFQNVSQNFLSRSFTSGDIRYLRGKFRSGNYSDGMVMLPVFSTYSEVASLKHWGKTYRQFGSTYSPDQEIVVVPCVGNMTDLSIKAEEGFQTVEVLDTDDDGTDEIVKVNFTGLDGEYSKYRVKIYKFNENATKLDSTVIDTKFQGVVNDGNKLWSPHCRTFIFGKFDYRGGAQLLSVSYNRDFKEQPVQSITSVLDLSTGKCGEHVTFDLTPGREHELVVADLDGDGWTDLCRADSDGFTKCVYDDRVFMFYGSYAGLPVEELGPDYYIADLNGDGLTDFLVPPAVGSGSTWNVFYFTGHEFVKKSMEICTRAEGDRFIFMDVNRDGLADMTLVSGGRLNYWINNGGEFSKNRAASSLSLPANCGVVPANVLDFNSPSQFVTVEGFYVKGYEFSCNRSSNRLLTKFENSLGAVEVNRYGDMCVSADVYQKDRERSYTLSNGFSRRAFHLNLLLGSETYPDENSSDCASNKSYTWFDAVYNSKGQGFCGFGKNRSIDYIDNSITVNVFDPERRGILVSSTVKQSGKTTESSTYEYDANSTDYGKLNPRLKRSVSSDCLTGLTTTVSVSYGDYDYPASITTERQIGSGIKHTESRSMTYDHKVTSSLYLLGQVLTDMKTKRESGTGASSLMWRDKQIWTYDSKSRPASRKTYTGELRMNTDVIKPIDPSIGPKLQSASANAVPSLTKDVTKLIETKVWTYDEYNNVLTEKTSPYGESSLSTTVSWTYDNSHRRVASETDAQGRTKRYVSYNKFGKPTAIVDHRGDTTSISYDTWGSLLETVSPDGTRSKVSTSWGGTGLYATTEWSNIAPSVVTCYDSYGRKIRTATQCYDGRWRIIDYEYDSKGRISRTSLPFRAASPEDGGEKLWNVTAYDVYGRKTSEALASGNRTTWEYHDNSVIETKNGVAVSRTYDAYGNLVLVSDAGGTLTYSLRTDGRPLSVSDSKGTVTKFDNDGYGRRSSIEDPSAGKTTDSYSVSNGQIAHTVKNPNGTIVTYTDAFGRVAKIDRRGEFQTEYSYNEDGQLVSEVSTNGTKKVRSYDSYGRLASETETIPDGKWLETTYSYNFGTQMKSAAYSCHTGQIAVENFLYGNGTLAEIVLSDGMIVTRIEDENELGQPLRVTTGEIQRDYTYTATGLPVGRSMAGGFLMDFEYDINALNGNLTSRTDRQHGLSETFSYDALNRLSYMDDRRVRYAPDGNLLSIDGVGEMLYTDEGSPYRITSFTPEDMSAVLSREQSVSYTCYGRPSRITEGGRSASFTYNGDGDRVKMFYSEGVSAVLNRYYIGGRYEQDIRRDGTSVERFYLGGDAYSAPMVLEKNGGSGWTPLNIGRDYLGSITTIATVDGNPLEEYSYDPWGRLRDPETHEIYAQGAEPELRLGRGFTSHEHLPWFGLINMNARLYDPLLCRFLSPDSYVQSPDFSQSFNRYSYAFNNPLAYNDPSGKIGWLILTFVYDFFRTLCTGGINADNEGARKAAWRKFDPTAEWSKTNKAWRIFAGNFRVSKEKNHSERFADLLSHWFYEFPQNIMGDIFSQASNMFDNVDVYYHHDATVVARHSDENLSWGVTFGNKINTLNADEQMVAHEYGHKEQSRLLGPFYLPIVGVPSIVGCGLDKGNQSSGHKHRNEWYETWANRLGSDSAFFYGDPGKWDDVKDPRTYNLDWYFYLTLAGYLFLGY